MKKDPASDRGEAVALHRMVSSAGIRTGHVHPRSACLDTHSDYPSVFSQAGTRLPVTWVSPMSNLLWDDAGHSSEALSTFILLCGHHCPPPTGFHLPSWHLHPPNDSILALCPRCHCHTPVCGCVCRNAPLGKNGNPCLHHDAASPTSYRTSVLLPLPPRAGSRGTRAQVVAVGSGAQSLGMRWRDHGHGQHPQCGPAGTLGWGYVFRLYMGKPPLAWVKEGSFKELKLWPGVG